MCYLRLTNEQYSKFYVHHNSFYSDLKFQGKIQGITEAFINILIKKAFLMSFLNLFFVHFKMVITDSKIYIEII